MLVRLPRLAGASSESCGWGGGPSPDPCNGDPPATPSACNELSPPWVDMITAPESAPGPCCSVVERVWLIPGTSIPRGSMLCGTVVSAPAAHTSVANYLNAFALSIRQHTPTGNSPYRALRGIARRAIELPGSPFRQEPSRLRVARPAVRPSPFCRSVRPHTRRSRTRALAPAQARPPVRPAAGFSTGSITPASTIWRTTSPIPPNARTKPSIGITSRPVSSSAGWSPSVLSLGE